MNTIAVVGRQHGVRVLSVVPSRLVDTRADGVKINSLDELVEGRCEEGSKDGSKPVDPVLGGE